jgi:hypothetical protein
MENKCTLYRVPTVDKTKLVQHPAHSRHSVNTHFLPQIKHNMPASRAGKRGSGISLPCAPQPPTSPVLLFCLKSPPTSWAAPASSLWGLPGRWFLLGAPCWWWPRELGGHEQDKILPSPRQAYGRSPPVMSGFPSPRGWVPAISAMLSFEAWSKRDGRR